ncbi:MAG: hypothetical protein Q9227_003973 [Pyrenula ochraceoflavens]
MTVELSSESPETDLTPTPDGSASLCSPPISPAEGCRPTAPGKSDNSTPKRVPGPPGQSSGRPENIYLKTPSASPNGVKRKRKIDVTSPTSFGRAKSVLGRALRSIKRPRFLAKRGDSRDRQQASADHSRPTTAPAVPGKLPAHPLESQEDPTSLEDPTARKRRLLTARAAVGQEHYPGCLYETSYPWHTQSQMASHVRRPHALTSLRRSNSTPAARMANIGSLSAPSRQTLDLNDNIDQWARAIADGAQDHDEGFAVSAQEIPSPFRFIPHFTLTSDTSISLEGPPSHTSSTWALATQVPISPGQSQTSGLETSGWSSDRHTPEAEQDNMTTATPNLSFGTTVSSTDLVSANNMEHDRRPTTPNLQTNFDPRDGASQVDEDDGERTPTQRQLRESPASASPQDISGVGIWAHNESRP